MLGPLLFFLLVKSYHHMGFHTTAMLMTSTHLLHSWISRYQDIRQKKHLLNHNPSKTELWYFHEDASLCCDLLIFLQSSQMSASSPTSEGSSFHGPLSFCSCPCHSPFLDICWLLLCYDIIMCCFYNVMVSLIRYHYGVALIDGH